MIKRLFRSGKLPVTEEEIQYLPDSQLFAGELNISQPQREGDGRQALVRTSPLSSACPSLKFPSKNPFEPCLKSGLLRSLARSAELPRDQEKTFPP